MEGGHDATRRQIIVAIQNAIGPDVVIATPSRLARARKWVNGQTGNLLVVGPLFGAIASGATADWGGLLAAFGLLP